MNRFRDMDLEPKTAEEVNACAEPRGIRKRIQLYARHDALTRAVLDMAYHMGLSGEDTMTLLAFEALKRLEKFTDKDIEYAMLNINPPPVYVRRDGVVGGYAFEGQIDPE